MRVSSAAFTTRRPASGRRQRSDRAIEERRRRRAQWSETPVLAYRGAVLSPLIYEGVRCRFARRREQYRAATSREAAVG